MHSKDIRQSFLKFFKTKGHEFIRSSSVVPIDDPTLLFTNAGMNQFKPIFLDEIKANDSRAVNSQKCIRVSGKHNDLEEVGVDTFHHTFFEMLGNWSFGDYYKKEAIEWAWQLLTEDWMLDKNRLWATVYAEDEEAFRLWTEVTDIDPSRVVKCGKKDNFWEMGETGPCGPCSEIHYFIGENIEDQQPSGVNVSDQYWELWNLVFIQNNRLADGSLEELPAKHVDTGAGLERIAAVLQNKNSNYDTDLFFPIIEALENIAGSSYAMEPIPHRVIADHIRMLCFSIADGALPSNEGRGYVLRRILRRAARFGRKLGLEEPFLFRLVDDVSTIMGEMYPEVIDKKIHIQKVIQSEEESFNHTLDRGLDHFEKIISNLDEKNQITGADAFKLYDTFGFPIDLTKLLSRERKMTVDEDGFNNLMAEQRSKAKNTKKFNKDPEKFDWTHVSKGDDSEFVGYVSTHFSGARIRRYAKNDGYWLLVLDKTPFYAESGGQVGDQGTIKLGSIELSVLDVQKNNNTHIHFCNGELEEFHGEVECNVDVVRRQSVMKNHTATHLMHKALKDILGTHVNQAGSLVHPDYLRFDLTHFEKISNDEIKSVENMVNEKILMNFVVDSTVETYDDAKNSGAEALFGEKYGNEVRVITVGDYSKELCGGTHVKRTGDIGSFKITDESSLSSGVRRLIAVTGHSSLAQMQRNATVINHIQSVLNIPADEMVNRIKTLLKEKKDLEKKLKVRNKSTNVDLDLTDEINQIGKYQSVVIRKDVATLDELKSIGDYIQKKLSSGIVVIFSKGEEKPMAVVSISKDLNEKGIFAGPIAKAIGSYMGGGGGGKPHMATAGGKNNESINSSIELTKKLIFESLNRKINAV